MRMHRRWLKRFPSLRLTGGLVALLLTLPALWPLAPVGFFVSDDGHFHIYRIAALADAWKNGVLYPRLFPEFGFGYGQATLNFYAPLSYAPGALLATLGVNPATAAELTIALGFVLAALAMYGFVRSLWGPVGGVLAAVAYTYFPYHLADAYVRGAIPEHFAFIFLPLILWTTTSIFREERPRGPLLWAALAWAGLIFTHNLTALLMAPVWVGYLLLLAAWTRRPRRLTLAPAHTGRCSAGVAAAGALGLALGLSAPLWLPFLAESRWVGIALGPSDGYQRHLASLDLLIQWQPLYHYRVQHGGVADHPLSWLTAILVAFMAGLFTWRLARPASPLPAGPLASRAAGEGAGARWLPAFALALTILAIFMTTNASLPVWIPLAPILANLQYPWRFLTLAAVGFALSLGALPGLLKPSRTSSGVRRLIEAGRGRSPRTSSGVRRLIEAGRGRSPRLVEAALLAALVSGLLLQPLLTVPAQPLSFPAADAWALDRMWREDAEAGQVGATWTGEFMPLTVPEQRWALGRPAESATAGPAITPRPQIRLARLGYDQVELEIQTAAPLSVRLHQFHLPAWQATLDGQPLATHPSGELGLVTADLPAGNGRLGFRFGPTAAWLIGGALAVIAALIWAGLAWRGRSRARGLAWGAAGLLLVVALLGLNRLGIGQRTWTPRPASATVGDVALLLGFDAAPARGAHALDVTLYWFALRDVGANYKVFVHLLGPDGAVIAQHDGEPGGGFTPTNRWRSGELIADRHRVPLPAGQPSGEYGLKAGMYQPNPPRNLPVDPPTGDGRVDLGAVRWTGK
ncbi:MAG: Bacterial rane protein YfhO [Chloroflexota bacterium]|nr:Bacterial rane protein YfhO [Chloroflexota bacterium]